MKQDKTSTQSSSSASREPVRVNLPGFISGEEIGLGDALKKVTASMGIKTCGGCQRRAEALNRWLTFTGRRRK